jgi:hypothetical protein
MADNLYEKNAGLIGRWAGLFALSFLTLPLVRRVPRYRAWLERRATVLGLKMGAVVAAASGKETR